MSEVSPKEGNASAGPAVQRIGQESVSTAEDLISREESARFRRSRRDGSGILQGRSLERVDMEEEARGVFTAEDLAPLEESAHFLRLRGEVAGSRSRAMHFVELERMRGISPRPRPDGEVGTRLQRMLSDIEEDSSSHVLRSIPSDIDMQDPHRDTLGSQSGTSLVAATKHILLVMIGILFDTLAEAFKRLMI